jgi:hypothetical protein
VLGLIAAIAGAACDGSSLVGASGLPPKGLGGTGSGGAASATELPPSDELSRFRRLTHAEWERTVQDLFLRDQGFGVAAAFRADARPGGYLFDGQSDALEVDALLQDNYQVAAAEVARRLAESEELVGALAPEDPELTEDERAEAFIAEFGPRAHRRPLTGAQRDAYFDLYEAGQSAYADAGGFVGGLRLVIEGLLQSPYFLYRVEEHSVDDGAGLDDYERANRLSYFLWGTMPDDALFSAAASGELQDELVVREHIRRMLTDARAGDAYRNFFQRVLEVERYETIGPSPETFPQVTEGLALAASEENSAFILHEMFEKSGSLRELLTSTITYVNAELASIYGLPGEFNGEMVAVELPPTERSGVLTQIGFLASHATSRDPDPIHRGVFIAQRLTCLSISAPPGGVPPLPPSVEGKTNRQRVAEHTEAAGTVCRNCHATIINPFGFAFEQFDAVGAFRQKDAGQPVDSSGVVTLDEVELSVGGAVDLSQALASSYAVHSCFSGHLVEYALGRSKVEADENLVEMLANSSLTDVVPFSDLMTEVAVAFLSMGRFAPETQP